MSLVTRAEWAKSLQRWAGIAVTKHNQWALVAWEAAEGGYFDSQGVWHPGALWNPLNTTQPMPNSWDFNWVHVKNYATEEEGLEATLKTLKQKNFLPILDSLANDETAAHTLEVVRDSEWGTGSFALRILHDVKSQWTYYSTKTIGQ